MPNDKAISLDNLQTFKTNCDSTYATKTELTEGLAGKQPTGNYALQTGTYAGMTVGNATKAEQDASGNNIADTYAKFTNSLGGFEAAPSASAHRGAAVGNNANTADGGAVGRDANSNNGGAVGHNSSTVAGGAVGHNADSDTGGAVGENSSSIGGGAVGENSSTSVGGAVGSGAQSINGFAGGYNAVASAANAVQLGAGTNATANTLQFLTYQLLDSNGIIPAERLNGSYPSLGAGFLANSLYVRQSATGWYKIAEFTITGSNYNVLSTIILVNGIYGTQTSGDVEESGLLEFDIRKIPDGILSTDCYLSILAGGLRPNHFAFNVSGNTASLYWYQDYEYASVKFTILDLKAENDDECSYKLVTIPNGGFPTGGEYAHNVAKAESDSDGNSISSTYTKKSAFNLSATHISSFLSGVSGWGDIYLSGKLGICTFSISLSSSVNAWTDKYIFYWSTISAMYRPDTGTVFGFLSCDSNNVWMQAGICASDSTGVKINGQSHSLDSGRALVGTVVYIAQNSV